MAGRRERAKSAGRVLYDRNQTASHYASTAKEELCGHHRPRARYRAVRLGKRDPLRNEWADVGFAMAWNPSLRPWARWPRCTWMLIGLVLDQSGKFVGGESDGQDFDQGSPPRLCPPEPTREEDWALKRISLECRDGDAMRFWTLGLWKDDTAQPDLGPVATERRAHFLRRARRHKGDSRKANMRRFLVPSYLQHDEHPRQSSFSPRNRGIADSEEESRVREIARLLELIPSSIAARRA